MSKLQIALVQSELIWENVSENIKHFETILSDVFADLIILPEMFTTGFTMEPSRVAEKMSGEGVKWLKQTAKQKNAVIIGSIAIEENNLFYNRLIAAFPDGKLVTYDKRHLFRMAGEDGVYTSGTTQTNFVWKSWTICPLICYDLRFPVWSRNKNDNPVDIYVFVANWPARRLHHWQRLLAARAIENQAFVAAVNRCGKDGNGVEYNGGTSLYNFQGDCLQQIIGDSKIITLEIDKNELNNYRNVFPAWRDADDFQINV